MQVVRKKSISQSEYFISLINQELDPYNVKIESPRDPLNRGSHVTISHSESWKICRALAKGGMGNRYGKEFDKAKNKAVVALDNMISYSKIGG